jgi:hypothetical protein
MFFNIYLHFHKIVFCLNQDVQDLRMYRMFFNIYLDFHKIALILISHNIKYYPVNPLILVILIQTIKYQYKTLC